MLAINFLIFLLGLCVGSFLNVLTYRLPHSLPITGRSFCPNCKKKISWQDNIPLLSFLLLRGKCRYCHSPISWQYPMVEFLTGVLFVMGYQGVLGNIREYQGWLELVYILLLLSILVVIFVTDLRYQVVPDQIVYPAILISFLFQFTNHQSPITNHQSPITNHLLSALAAVGFFLLLHFITRRRGMGMGDVKLAFLMGLILGFPQIIIAFYLAFLTGALVGVILILTGKKRFGEQVPFGPFLTSATLIALFWGDEILKWFTARFF